jgi:hypothetical protein
MKTTKEKLSLNTKQQNYFFVPWMVCSGCDNHVAGGGDERGHIGDQQELRSLLSNNEQG